MPKSWDHFYQLTKDNPPSAGLIKAVALAAYPGKALDLGCGAGRDTRYLLAQGFQVTAVDQDPAVLAILSQLPTEHLSIVQSSFEDFAFAHYNLINAHFALPFMGKETFSIVFSRLKDALKPHGIFAGQFFGIHDSWNANPNSSVAFFTRAQALDELKGLDIITFDEVEIDGHTVEGKPKHWHIYHIATRKPA